MANKQLRTLALMLTAFALGSVLLAACVRPGTPTASTGSGSSSSTPSSSSTGSCPSGSSVTTGLSAFEQTCITISKGSMLKFVPGQGSAYHSLDYGEWNNGAAQSTTYNNAPKLSNLAVQSQTVALGPFTTAGTYHIYCTVHSNMNLTVIVK